MTLHLDKCNQNKLCSIYNIFRGMSWMRHNLTLVTQSMWSFWGWVEQSTLKCIDLCFFIIIIVIIIIFNGGNPPVTNPHHYHYCQNPIMVGFWLVGICWGTITTSTTIVNFIVVFLWSYYLSNPKIKHWSQWRITKELLSNKASQSLSASAALTMKSPKLPEPLNK